MRDARARSATCRVRVWFIAEALRGTEPKFKKSELCRVRIGAADFTQHVTDLLFRYVDAGRFDDGGHEIGPVLGGATHGSEGPFDFISASAGFDTCEILDLLPLHRLIDLERRNRVVPVHAKAVDADHHALASIELLLELVARAGD